MRISDWSSDVCSSDLPDERAVADRGAVRGRHRARGRIDGNDAAPGQHRPRAFGPEGGRPDQQSLERDRKSVVSGKSVSVRVDLGGRRISQKKRMRVNDREHRVLDSETILKKNT